MGLALRAEQFGQAPAEGRGKQRAAWATSMLLAAV